MPTSFKDQFQLMRKRLNAIDNGKDLLSKTFSGQLFTEASWFLSLLPEQENAPSKPIPEEKKKRPSERLQTLESLRQFAEEKTEEKKEKVIKFDGGELEVTGTSKPGLIYHHYERESSLLVDEDNIDILFLGDPEREGEDDLLGKMIGAMNLKESSFKRFPLPEFELEEQKEKFLANFCDRVYAYKPKIVVCLGAAATNLLLKKRERLSLVHGRFFDSHFSFVGGDFECPIVPIFHPDFLVINPKMKRTAWIDLQKVMEFLNKN